MKNKKSIKIIQKAEKSLLSGLVLCAMLISCRTPRPKSAQAATHEIKMEEPGEFEPIDIENFTNDYGNDTGEIFIYTEVEPAFPGGDSALYAYIRQNRIYPQSALKAGIEGVVVVEFVVERDGSLSNVVVKRKVDPSLDEEAMRLIKSMPKWSPGKQKGKVLRCLFRIPIYFSL